MNMTLDDENNVDTTSCLPATLQQNLGNLKQVLDLGRIYPLRIPNPVGSPKSQHPHYRLTSPRDLIQGHSQTISILKSTNG